MPSYFSFGKTKVKADKRAGRKGKLLGGFRDDLYKFGKVSGEVNAFLQNPFLQSSRRTAYTTARAAGTLSALTTGDFKRKYGSVQSSIIRGSRIATGRLSGLAIQQVVPRSLGPIMGRQVRRELGKYISSSPFYRNLNKKIESTVAGFFNSYAQPQYNHVVKSMNTREFMDFQIARNEDLIRRSAPDISSGQYMLGVGAQDLGLNIKDKYLDQTMYDEDRGQVFDENFTIRSMIKPGRNAEYKTMDVFGFSEPGQAREFLLKSIHRQFVKEGKSKKYLFKGGIRIGSSRKNGTKADLFPWIWLVEYGGPIIQPVNTWNGKRMVVKDIKKYIPPTLFVTRSTIAVNNMKIKGAKIKINTAMPRVAGFKNPLAYMQDVLGTRGAYGKQVRNQGMRVKRKGGISYRNKSLFSALNRRDRGRHPDMGIKRDNIVGRNRRYYKYQQRHEPIGVKVHSTHGVQYSQELQDALGVSFAPAEINASIVFKNVGQIKGGVTGREKFLTDLLSNRNPSKAGGASRAGLLHEVELLNNMGEGERAFNATAASNFIDFDQSDVSGQSGFGKLSGKKLSGFIKKNYNVRVVRESGAGGSNRYNVVLTAKNAGKRKSRRSPSDKRFNKTARRPLQKFTNDDKRLARLMLQNANYEEIIDAAKRFNS